jgi:hypothetical protein
MLVLIMTEGIYSSLPERGSCYSILMRKQGLKEKKRFYFATPVRLSIKASATLNKFCFASRRQ